MNKLLMILLFATLSATAVFAQEKTVDDMSVYFGLLSWEEIEKGIKETPLAHTEEFHRKMAKSMSDMHKGGYKGSYHVMVLLKDRDTGRQIANEEVWVTAVSKAGPEEISQRLEPMAMDGFAGYGGFFKLTFRGPYVFRVKIVLKSIKPIGGLVRRVEFERAIP